MERLGRYELIRKLGSGGMGTVHEAVLHGPSGFRKRVALKILHDDGTRLAREARVGALFNHPNVLSTLELGQHDGVWFLAMELVDGTTINTMGRLPAGPALDVAIQTCAGLAHIHGLKLEGRGLALVHRDIKPGNLLVTRSGLIKIADFGMTARPGDDAPGGTPGYMPAEQIDGEEDARSDLFALGVTLVRLMTGTKPFGGGRGALVAVQGTEKRMPRAPGLAEVEALAPGLRAIVERCLRTDPENRFASAGELARSLRAVRARLTTEPTIGTVCLEQLEGVQPSEMIPRVRTQTPTAHYKRTNIVDALPLVGRDDEQQQIAAALSQHRIVTVTGPPGVGKTALCQEVARVAARQFRGGSWLCDLSETTDLGGVITEIASALGTQLPTDEPLQALGRTLRARSSVVLLLDNCEQVTAPVVQAVTALTASAPKLVVLATSRTPLRVKGETVIGLQPLERASAVALFCARSGLEPDDDIAALADGLDGLPLALELAASRARFMPPRELLAHLGDRFRLLAEGPDRSLKASLEGSWALLGESTRLAMAQLSVFTGPFHLEEAAGVLDLGLDGPWPLDVVQTLVEHSLLHCDGERFRMLLSVREFAAQHLEAAETDAARRRHAEAYARLGTDDAVEEAYRSYDEAVHARYADAVHNLVAACEWAIGAGETTLALDLGSAALVELRRTWPRSGQKLLQRIEQLELTPIDRARSVLQRLGAAALHDPAELEPLLELEADPAVRARKRLWGRMKEQIGYTRAVVFGDVVAALPDLNAGLDVAREQGDTYGAIRALLALGEAAMRQGDPGAALGHFEAAVAMARAAGSAFGVAGARTGLAQALTLAGRPDEAAEAFEQASHGFESLGHVRNIANVGAELAALDIEHGDPNAARLGALTALDLLEGRVDDAMPIVVAHLVLARLALHTGDTEAAAERLARVDTVLHTDPWPRGRAEADLVQARLESPTAAATRLQALVDRPGSLPDEVARAHLELASLALDAGRLDDAAAQVDLAAGVCPDHPPTLGVRVAIGRARLAAASGDASAQLGRIESAVAALSPGPASDLTRDLDALRAAVGP